MFLSKSKKVVLTRKCIEFFRIKALAKLYFTVFSLFKLNTMVYEDQVYGEFKTFSKYLFNERYMLGDIGDIGRTKKCTDFQLECFALLSHNYKNETL